jgi:hypothetical protein
MGLRHSFRREMRTTSSPHAGRPLLVVLRKEELLHGVSERLRVGVASTAAAAAAAAESAGAAAGDGPDGCWRAGKQRIGPDWSMRRRVPPVPEICNCCKCWRRSGECAGGRGDAVVVVVVAAAAVDGVVGRTRVADRPRARFEEKGVFEVANLLCLQVFSFSTGIVFVAGSSLLGQESV